MYKFRSNWNLTCPVLQKVYSTLYSRDLRVSGLLCFALLACFMFFLCWICSFVCLSALFVLFVRVFLYIIRNATVSFFFRCPSARIFFCNRLQFYVGCCVTDEQRSSSNEEAVGGGDERGQHARNPAAITPRVDQPGRECRSRGTPFFSLRYAVRTRQQLKAYCICWLRLSAYCGLER